MTSGFNNIKNEWFNSYANVNDCKCVKNSMTHSSINVRHSWVDLAIIVVWNLFFISSYGINTDVIHLLSCLNIDIMCIVLTQISYAYSYCLNMNVVCQLTSNTVWAPRISRLSFIRGNLIRVVYTWKSCTWLPCINNAQHLNNTNLWNNKFCMHLEWTHEACKFMMLSCYVCFNIY